MPKKKRETLSTRVTRLENGHRRLEKALVQLAEIQAEHVRRTEDQFQRTSVFIADLQAEAAERDKAADERIGKWVSAIGALISRMDARLLREEKQE